MNPDEKITKLAGMIRGAMMGEAFAYTAYGIYADKCREAGLIEGAMKLEEAAANEREHCEQWMKILKMIPENPNDIITKAAEMENKDANKMYAELAAFVEANFPEQSEIYEKAYHLIAIERRHETMFLMLNNLYTKGIDKPLPGMWVCSHCGNFYFKEEDIPDICPVCEHEKKDYVYIGGEL